MIDAERLARTFVELCRIPSPSGQEGALAAYVRARVEALGLDVTEDDAGQALGSDTGNLIVHTEGVGEPFFLTAHMDTVPPKPLDGQVPVIVEGDRVHTGGRSILGGDDKAGVAVALEMLRLAKAHTARPLDVVFTIQEEQGARGAAHLAAEHLRARMGFVLDGDTPVGVAIRRSPHKARYYITVKGRAAHAALNPQDGINAIAAAGAIAATLPTSKLDELSIANIGRIEGGGAINVVPERAELIGEVRSLEQDALDALKVRIEALAQEQARAYGASAEVRWEALYPGYAVAENAPIARLFAEACAAEGVEAAFESTYGGGDANPLNGRGLSCVVFGLGMQAIHSPQEFILLSDLVRAARILWQALRV